MSGDAHLRGSDTSYRAPRAAFWRLAAALAVLFAASVSVTSLVPKGYIDLLWSLVLLFFGGKAYLNPRALFERPSKSDRRVIRILGLALMIGATAAATLQIQSMFLPE
jgi:hypothetical protein